MRTVDLNIFQKKLFERHTRELELFLIEFRSSNDLFPCEIVVFGSSVRNEIKIFSDIDLAIISDHFLDIPWVDRINYLKTELTKKSRVISVIGITKKEFKDNRYPTIIRVVREMGIVLNIEIT